ncbi:aconitase X swivel domain-containing protein [Thermodesulfobacteriota bacterium]
MIKLKGRTVNPGRTAGKAVVTKIPFSFLGELDPMSGKYLGADQELRGQSLAGKVLICPTGKGSTGGPSVAFRAMETGVAPKAIICLEAEPVIALSAITAEIPMVDRLDMNPLELIDTGDYVCVDATEGLVEITKETVEKANG